MNKNLTQVQQRAIQYWFEDGLVELSLGFFCLLLSALFWFQQAMPNSPFNTMAFVLVAFGCGYMIRWVIVRIKERTTYPRTGYIAYKTGWDNKRALAVAIAFTVLLLALNFYLAMQGPQSSVWTPVVGGLILAFIFTMTGYQTGLPRFYFLALFCLLSGVVLAISGLGDLSGAAILSGLTSLVLFVFGSLTRRAYWQQNPRPPEETDGN